MTSTVKLAGDAAGFSALFKNLDIAGSLTNLKSTIGETSVMGNLDSIFSPTAMSSFSEVGGFVKFQNVSKSLGGILSQVSDIGTITSIMKGFPDGVMTSVIKNMDPTDATKILKKMDPDDAASLFKNVDVGDTASILKRMDNADASKILKNMDEAKRADIAKKMNKAWDPQTMALVAAAVVVTGSALAAESESARKKAIKECKEQCLPEGWGSGPSPELKYKELDESDHGIVCTTEQDDCEQYCDDKCNKKYEDFGSAGLGDDTENFFNKMFKNLNPLEWFKNIEERVAWFLRIFIFIISFLLCGGCIFMLIKAFT